MGVSVVKGAVVLAFAFFTGLCWAVEFTTTEINISPGRPFTLTWEDANGSVKISLLTGTSSNLETVEVIYSGDTGNSYTWTPPDDLPSGIYVFSISDSDDLNYSTQWSYEASDNAPTSSSSSTSTPTPTPTSTSISTPTTTTKLPPTTMITTTTVPATSTTDVTSSTSALTTKSSTLPEPTPTTGSSSADDSEHTSLSSIPTSSTTVPSTSLESPTGRPADSSTETPKPMANGLSTGAKAGIGVGAGVGGLGLLSLAGFLLYRCGKAASRQDGNGGDTVNRESKTELGGDPVLRSELGGQGLAEMHSDQVIPELWQGHHHDDEWRRQPTELDASDTGRMRT